METKAQFQTPIEVAKYMVSMAPKDARSFFEPTKGEGNIATEIMKHPKFSSIDHPENFFDHPAYHYDCIIMNPPFSAKYAFGIPETLDVKGMRIGYYILSECMKRSDHIIALMPWFTITDSDVRLRTLNEFGLKSITALPRKTFGYTRIQTCIFELHKDWKNKTIFKTFNY